MNKTIYFGHQSVGFNIMDGVQKVLEENPQIGLQVMETGEPSNLTKGVFAHSKIGENNKPITKMEGLELFLKREGADRVDVAFVKLCFVDIMGNTDVDALFGEYRAILSNLKEAHPETTFVHFTIPLRVRMAPSLKYTIRKKLTGWVAFADNAHNVARNRYNELLLREYGGKEPIFDLAAIESTHSNGKREVYELNGTKCYSLVPEFSHDGGHLNDLGRKHVAEQLLIFLANLS